MSFTVVVSATTRAPLAEVFDFVADFRNAPTWQRQLVGVRLDEGPFPSGKRVVELRSFLGKRIEAPGDLVSWQRLVGFTVRGSSGPLYVESDYGFKADGTGTLVTLHLTMTARGLARVAEPVLRRSMERELAAAFLRLGPVLDALVEPDPSMEPS